MPFDECDLAVARPPFELLFADDRIVNVRERFGVNELPQVVSCRETVQVSRAMSLDSRGKVRRDAYVEYSTLRKAGYDVDVIGPAREHLLALIGSSDARLSGFIARLRVGSFASLRMTAEGDELPTVELILI
jgi:hypothetical protein